jgi:hypothetical protein
MRGTPCSVKAPLTIERGGQVGDMLQPIAQPRVLDEIARVGRARLVRAVVKDLQAARSGHEVHPVAAQGGVRLPGAVVQCELARRAGDPSTRTICSSEMTLMEGRIVPSEFRSQGSGARTINDVH